MSILLVVFIVIWWHLGVELFKKLNRSSVKESLWILWDRLDYYSWD